MHLDELMAKLYIEKVDIMEIYRNLVIYFEAIPLYRHFKYNNISWCYIYIYIHLTGKQ